MSVRRCRHQIAWPRQQLQRYLICHGAGLEQKRIFVPEELRHPVLKQLLVERQAFNSACQF